MFSCEFCEIFNKTFFCRTPPVAAPVRKKKSVYILLSLTCDLAFLVIILKLQSVVASGNYLAKYLAKNTSLFISGFSLMLAPMFSLWWPNLTSVNNYLNCFSHIEFYLFQGSPYLDWYTGNKEAYCHFSLLKLFVITAWFFRFSWFSMWLAINYLT